MNTKYIYLIVLLIGLFLPALSQTLSKSDTITAYVATDRIGQSVIIKGNVATVFYAKNSTGKPTFLNLEQPFPK